MRFSWLIVLLLAGCSTTGLSLERGALSPDTIVVAPTANLAGVTLKVPEIYVGDAVGNSARLNLDQIDVALLTEAATLARLQEAGYQAQLRENAARLSTAPRYEVHSAVTEFDLTQLRQTGRIRMSMVVMLVDAAGQYEISRGAVTRDYQLFDVAPDEAGAIGDSRFIEARLKAFTEGLAREAVDAAGF